MFGSMDRPVPTDVFPERDVCLEFCDHSSINDISVNLAEETIHFYFRSPSYDIFKIWINGAYQLVVEVVLRYHSGPRF